MAAQAGAKQTTAAQMSASPAAAADDAWSRLPVDPLSVVYSRIPSPLDRVRFTGVCNSWRHVLSCRPPQPALPWLILSPYEDGAAERVFSPVDGTVFRIPLPAKAIGMRLVGSHDGGWIVAASTGNAATSLVIVNLFSGIEVPLSAVQRRILDAPVQKIIFSEDPTSKRCILAAILTNRSTLGLCKVGCRDRGWSMSVQPIFFSDIAFCRGTLYGINNHNELFMFDPTASVVSATYPLRIQEPSRIYSWGNPRINYIFTHNDKLFMAQRTKWSQEGEVFFKVFELSKIDKDKTTEYDYMWAEVMSLDNHALFLSVPYSNFVHVPRGCHGDVERNHIYYNHPHASSISDVVQLNMCDNGNHMYRTKDRKISAVDRITSFRYYMANGCPTLMWLIPPNS
ncbi:putative F-box protein At5g55150 [Aegilops tauschii subsp. strangulata]|uniref:putative F-box protein At5g55150 n=1 Tax=Aegilops tauschii subsp. strangulata TaxID=200361 RepID=UPI00098A9A04|nr:putative F-box protein At5g55150 [Aegilops tauschii subsp. strangulata]